MELERENNKIRKVVIVGHLPAGRMALFTRLLADKDIQLINVLDKNELKGMNYDQVFMDELSEDTVRRMDQIPALEMYRPTRRSRGHGKKYKDWERR